MQKFFFKAIERRHNLDKVINNINKLINHFDACSLPIFHVISCYQADGSDWDLKMKVAGKPELIEGTQEAAILRPRQASDVFESPWSPEVFPFQSNLLTADFQEAGY